MEVGRVCRDEGLVSFGGFFEEMRKGEVEWEDWRMLGGGSKVSTFF